MSYYVVLYDGMETIYGKYSAVLHIIDGRYTPRPGT